MNNRCKKINKKGESFVIMLLLAFIVAMFTSLTVSAADIYVTKNGSDSSTCGSISTPCATITVGIENATATSEVSTVFVGPGTYTENVVISTADLTILSTDGRDSTIIDASNNPTYPAMRVINSGVSIGELDQGFTFTGSQASGFRSNADNIRVRGNKSVGNRLFGFQFGNVSVQLSNMGLWPETDPILSAILTSTLNDDSEQTNNYISGNSAESNLVGFYFSHFDNSIVFNNVADNNFRSDTSIQAQQQLGNGFTIAEDSDFDYFISNGATVNEVDGFWYFIQVTDQRSYNNYAVLNGSDGFRYMGKPLRVIGNFSVHNGDYGIHFMGYSGVLDLRENMLMGNSIAGIYFANSVTSMTTETVNTDSNNFFNSNGSTGCPVLMEQGADIIVNGQNNFWDASDVPTSPKCGPNLNFTNNSSVPN